MTNIKKINKNYSNRRIKNKLYNLKRNTKNSIITWSNILFLYLHLSLSEAYLLCFATKLQD